MMKFGHHIRPVGDKILLKKKDFDYDIFYPYKIHFYQSGTAALSAAVKACIDRKNIDAPEVLLPAYACPDLISAIIFAGAKPVLVDLQADTPWMSLDDLQKQLNQRTVAIIAVNFLGITERLNDLKKISNEHNISLIEDSAQGLPDKYYNKYWQGDYIILSFGRGKPLNLLGGGAILTNQNSISDNHLANISPYRNTFIKNIMYSTKIKIYNLMINSFIYSFLIKIPGLNIGDTIFKPLLKISSIADSTILKLHSNYERYKEKDKSGEIITKYLRNIKSNQLIDLTNLCTNRKALLRYPILIKNTKVKNKFVEKFKNKGISEMYKIELCKIKGVSYYIDLTKDNSNASSFAKFLVTLPTHDDFNENDIREVYNFLKENLR